MEQASGSRCVLVVSTWSSAGADSAIVATPEGQLAVCSRRREIPHAGHRRSQAGSSTLASTAQPLHHPPHGARPTGKAHDRSQQAQGPWSPIWRAQRPSRTRTADERPEVITVVSPEDEAIVFPAAPGCGTPVDITEIHEGWPSDASVAAHYFAEWRNMSSWL